MLTKTKKTSLDIVGPEDNPKVIKLMKSLNYSIVYESTDKTAFKFADLTDISRPKITVYTDLNLYTLEYTISNTNVQITSSTTSDIFDTKRLDEQLNYFTKLLNTLRSNNLA